jgi:hypothetical protein
MTDDDLDEVLLREDDFVPSSGFAAGAMGAVRREASAPPPIPFPWKRALPGLAAAALSLLPFLVLTFTECLRGAAASTDQAAPGLIAILKSADHLGMGWIALPLLLSFPFVHVSMRLAGGSTLTDYQHRTARVSRPISPSSAASLSARDNLHEFPHRATWHADPNLVWKRLLCYAHTYIC